MQRIKPSVVLAAAAVVGIALYASAYVDQTGSRMAMATKRFVDSLPQGKAEKATFRFDDPERLNWHFIPRDRLGLPIKELTPEQRALAFGLISTGLDGGGYLKATTIPLAQLRARGRQDRRRDAHLLWCQPGRGAAGPPAGPPHPG